MKPYIEQIHGLPEALSKIAGGINAKSFGVKGDGVTDDAPALQAAIDFARTNNGATISLDPGDYIIGSTLVASSSADQGSLKIIGEAAMGSILGNKPVRLLRPIGTTHTLLTTLGRGLWLENITFDGQNTRGHLVTVDRGFEFSCVKVRFVDAKGYGLLAKALSNAYINKVHFDRVGTDTTFTDGAITAGSGVLTSATGAFYPSDIGAVITVTGAGADGGDLVTTILGYTDPQTVTLRSEASTTVNGATVNYGCAALRLQGNSEREFVSNATRLIDVHMERNTGIDLDVAYGNNVDDLAEFTMVEGLHIEASIDNSTMTEYKTAPLIRLGNVRGFTMSNFFTYGGKGTHLVYHKKRDISGSSADGVSISNGYMLGHLSSHAVHVGTPDRFIDLIRGNGFQMSGVIMDTALVEHIRIRSTFEKKAWIFSPHHKTRTGATAVYVVDDRSAPLNVTPASMPATQFDGDISAISTLDARLIHISTPSATNGVLRYETGGVARWDIRKSDVSETGSNVGADLEFVSKSDAGSSLLTVLTLRRSDGRTMFAGDLQINDKNIVLGTSTGTKIGTASTQKIGFYGATPVVKPQVTGSTGGNAALTSLLSALAALGIITNSSTA